MYRYQCRIHRGAVRITEQAVVYVRSRRLVRGPVYDRGSRRNSGGEHPRNDRWIGYRPGRVLEHADVSAGALRPSGSKKIDRNGGQVYSSINTGPARLHTEIVRRARGIYKARIRPNLVDADAAAAPRQHGADAVHDVVVEDATGGRGGVLGHRGTVGFIKDIVF